MKKSEKQMILILVVVAIIIIAVLVKVKNSSQENVADNNTTIGTDTSSNSTSSTSPANDVEEFVEKLEDGTKLNVSEKLSQTKKVGDYELSNIQVTNKDGQSVLVADVKNTSSAKINMRFAKVVFLDKEGNEITSTDAIIGDVEAGQTVQLIASVTTDFSNAYDFSIQLQ